MLNNIRVNKPKSVIELDTSIERAQTRAILMPTRRLVEEWRVLRGLRMPRYRPRLMKHMCMMLEEQASTSHVTYTLHQTTPSGQ